MALIKCPECGQNVSDTCKHCIHCGCEITLCKECGTYYAGRGSCPSCGFGEIAAKAESVTSVPPQTESATPQKSVDELERILEKQSMKSVDNLENIFQTWKNDPKSGSGAVTVCNVLDWVSFSLVLILWIALILVVFVYWQPKEMSEKLLCLLEYKNILTALCVSTIISYFIGCVSNFEDLVMHLKCGNWLREKNLDIAEELRALKKVEDGKLKIFFKKFGTIVKGDKLKNAYYLSKNPNEKSSRIAMSILKALATFLVKVFFMVIATQLLYRAGAMEVIGGSISNLGDILSLVSTALWVVFIIVIIAKIVLWAIDKFVFDKKQKEWYKSIAPDLEDYE